MEGADGLSADKHWCCALSHQHTAMREPDCERTDYVKVCLFLTVRMYRNKKSVPSFLVYLENTLV